MMGGFGGSGYGAKLVVKSQGNRDIGMTQGGNYSGGIGMDMLVVAYVEILWILGWWCGGGGGIVGLRKLIHFYDVVHWKW